MTAARKLVRPDPAVLHADPYACRLDLRRGDGLVAADRGHDERDDERAGCARVMRRVQQRVKLTT